MTQNHALFLGIDTATPWRSVGLVGEENRSASIHWKATRDQGRDLLPKIEDFLHQEGVVPKDLEGIAVVAGPGSFTALRVGVSVAQGLGMGLEIPVVPVGSLEIYPPLLPLAETRATVLLPSRNGEVFVQTFQREGMEGWCAENVIRCLPVEAVARAIDSPGILIGSGIQSYRAEIGSLFGETTRVGDERFQVPQGSTIARVGRVKWLNNPEGFSADSVAMNYHQSHGALTIEERKGRQTQ
ncbi:MAG: tRNA (adenosine(37)-N6)-threonylcarbamoyltransferase complex dimerization subunit type 1 TsaB [Candidatus Omnitrophica bacterium]|nr:tRNA (adenosine(37)-N6)-threonylcarbamoyltransferase complex dimerization subunit type 1 TsaB [Candidatus Omnitrophota bacterium]